MSFKTISELTQMVLRELVLVSGTGVQIYTEPSIKHQIEVAAKHYFRMRFWDHLTNVDRYTLDGVAGVANTTIVPIDEAVDIEWIRVYPFRECDELEYRPNGFFLDNDYGWSMFNYDHPQRVTKGFFVAPITTAGDIAVRTRRMIVNFADVDAIIPFDDIMIHHFIAAQMLASDGMNASMQQMQMALAEDRYTNLIAAEGDKPIYSRRHQTGYATSFTVAP